MQLHTVTIPARNLDEDVAAALKREGTFDAITGDGIAVSFAPVSLPDETDNPIWDVARLGKRIAANVRDGLAAGDPVLVIGGNCNALPGVLGGFQGTYGPATKIGLVWFDAHGDFNTPKTTITGRLGGMPVAVAAGLCFPSWRDIAGMATPLPTDRILMVDVRNLDPKEHELIAATDVMMVSASADYLRSGPGRFPATVGDHIEVFAPDGPDIATVQEAVRLVFAKGKVRALGLVSVYLSGAGADTSLASAAALLTAGVRDWQTAGGV